MSERPWHIGMNAAKDFLHAVDAGLGVIKLDLEVTFGVKRSAQWPV